MKSLADTAGRAQYPQERRRRYRSPHGDGQAHHRWAANRINIIFIVIHLSLGASLSVQPRPGNRTPVANKTKQKPVSDRIIALNGFTVFSLKPAIFVLAPPRRLMDATE